MSIQQRNPMVDTELEAELSNAYKNIRRKTGMEKEQGRIEQQQQELLQEEIQKPQRKAFDIFHSPLRIFNPNTCLSSSYKSLLIGPTLDTLGRALCFANDEDCEAIRHPFDKKYSKSRTALAFLKAGTSVLGVIIRGSGTILSYASNLIASSITSILKRKPSHFIDDILGKHYKMIEPEKPVPESTKKNENELKVLTLNCGLLRDLFWDIGGREVKGDKLPFNELTPPRERAIELANKIIEIDKKNPRDVVCLQEIFDNLAYFGLGKDAQEILIERLKEHFPYIIYDVGQRSWPAVGSGLVLLSKTEILEAEYHRYPNLVGLDTTSNKGFLAAKIKKGDQFFTVYNTHTQAGRGGLPTTWIEKLIHWFAPIKTPGEVRGEQLGLIEKHRTIWAAQPPKGHKSLKHMDTVLTGDINQPLNDADKVFSRSHHKNPVETNRKKGEIKYQGQAELLKHFHFTLPENFVDTKIHEPIYILEVAGKSYKVNVGATPLFDGQGLPENFLKNHLHKIRVQEVNEQGEVVERALNAQEISHGKFKQVRKGEDPLRLKQLEILIKLEKEKMLKTLSAKFPKVSGDKLRQLIEDKFEVMTGSVMSKASLKSALSAKAPKPGAADIAEPKELDIATSQNAKHSRVCLVTPKISKNRDLLFSKNKPIPLATDHLGMMADFTYNKNAPKR